MAGWGGGTRGGGFGRVLATTVVIVGGITGAVLTGGGSGGEAVSANLYAVATSGNPNCTRSSTLITYQQAVDAGGGAICGPGVRTSNGSIDGTAWGNSCHAATGGDKVAVKNGNYAQTPSNGFLLDGNLDCSDGAGADYNPNWEEQGGSQGSLANWVTFVPGDAAPAITFNVGSFTIPRGNYHMIWEGIDVNTGIRFNYGGESAGQQAKNIIIRGKSSTDLATLYGVQITGSKNILLKDINNGPSNQCAKNDAFVPVAWRCNPSGPWFESQYANAGTANASCNPESPGNDVNCGGWWANGGSEWAELYIHDGGAGGYENIRLENFINHDQQSIQDSTCCAHPGGLMHFGGGNVISTAHNAVLDHYVLERPAGASVQFSDNGWTVQNSVFGCQVQSLENTGGVWDGACAGKAFGFGVKLGSGASNVLIRYNYFGASGAFEGLTINTGDPFINNFSNVRIVGNVFADAVTCSVTGVTYDSNTFVNGVSTCGTNATSLGAGDPVVNSSYDTADNLYKLEGATIDAHKDGSPALPDLTMTGDLNLNHDADRDTRSGTTRPGVDN
jgi:hypothetical protein